MIARIRVGPNERLLVNDRADNYKIFEPGWAWLKLGQYPVTTVSVAPQAQTVTFVEVQTVENIPLDVSLQMVYHIDPARLTPALYPNLVGLNEKGWQMAIQSHTEYVLRQLLGDYSWQNLDRKVIRQRVERLLLRTLATRLEKLAVNILSLGLMKITPPPTLQRTLVRAEQDRVEAQGRISVLNDYFEIFGGDLPQAMPYVIQWEFLNMLHKQENPNVVLAAANLFQPGSTVNSEPMQQVFQMRFPILTDNKQQLELKN